MTPAAFEAVVDRAIAAIPARFRARMTNLLIVVENRHPRHDLLGLYEGRPLTERSLADPAAGPDRIRIFQRPHEELARTPAELEQIVFDTVWHEVGHYFGLSEKEIARIEQRRFRLRALGRGAKTYNTWR